MDELEHEELVVLPVHGEEEEQGGVPEVERFKVIFGKFWADNQNTSLNKIESVIIGQHTSHLL